MGKHLKSQIKLAKVSCVFKFIQLPHKPRKEVMGICQDKFSKDSCGKLKQEIIFMELYPEMNSSREIKETCYFSEVLIMSKWSRKNGEEGGKLEIFDGQNLLKLVN